MGEVDILFPMWKVVSKYINGCGIGDAVIEVGIYGSTTMEQIGAGKHYKKSFEAIMSIYHALYSLYRYSPSVFIDLPKAFDTVRHSIILKKLEIYGIYIKNLECFKIYLRNRKQYIQSDDKNKTDILSVTRGVPQGSILESLLFLLYVNDLPNASKILDPIMFADDTNLIFSNCDIPVLFATVNSELNKIN